MKPQTDVFDCEQQNEQIKISCDFSFIHQVYGINILFPSCSNALYLVSFISGQHKKTVRLNLRLIHPQYNHKFQADFKELSS